MRHNWVGLHTEKSKPRVGHSIIPCSNCGKCYYQERHATSIFARDLDYDICPHCSACNGVSRTITYNNRKLVEGDIRKKGAK